MNVAALFVREDSEYKKREDVDAWDVGRNAMMYDGDYPVIAHPPCRAWGMLSHMAFNALPGEKNLARIAICLVRVNGGIVEHPVGSGLWDEMKLPKHGMFTDEFGGYTIDIDQFWFGHVAHKMTRLYICGVNFDDLPVIPKKYGETDRSICGNVPGTTRCTQYQREYTPPQLMDWLIAVAIKAGNT